MRLEAKILHRLTYDRIAYEPIREDFVRWYLSAYRDQSLGEEVELDNGQLMDLALKTREEAIQYEPDTSLNTAVDVVDSVGRTVKFFSAIATVVGISVGGLLLKIGLGPLPEPEFLYSIILGSIGVLVLSFLGSALPLYTILKYITKTNEELIRLYNEKLVASIGRVRANDRRGEMLLALYIWHSSLCSTTKQTPVIMLGVIRAISPRIYGIVSHRLQEDIGEFFETEFWEIVGREYVRVNQDIRD